MDVFHIMNYIGVDMTKHRKQLPILGSTLIVVGIAILVKTGAVSNCNMVTGRFVSEHWRQCYTMQRHNTTHAVQGKVIVAGLETMDQAVIAGLALTLT